MRENIEKFPSFLKHEKFRKIIKQLKIMNSRFFQDLKKVQKLSFAQIVKKRGTWMFIVYIINNVKRGIYWPIFTVCRLAVPFQEH